MNQIKELLTLLSITPANVDKYDNERHMHLYYAGYNLLAIFDFIDNDSIQIDFLFSSDDDWTKNMIINISFNDFKEFIEMRNEHLMLESNSMLMNKIGLDEYESRIELIKNVLMNGENAKGIHSFKIKIEKAEDKLCKNDITTYVEFKLNKNNKLMTFKLQHSSIVKENELQSMGNIEILFNHPIYETHFITMESLSILIPVLDLELYPILNERLTISPNNSRINSTLKVVEENCSDNNIISNIKKLSNNVNLKKSLLAIELKNELYKKIDSHTKVKI